MRCSPWESVYITAHVRNKSVQGRPDPQMDLSPWMGLVVDQLAPCSALGGLTCGTDEDQRRCADLVSMLENLGVGFKLGLQPGVFRLGGVSLTSIPLVIYRFFAILGPSQPLLIYQR